MLHMNRFLPCMLAMLALLALGACSTPKPTQMSSASAAGMGVSNAASAAGTVQAVERVAQQDAGIGVGTITGVVVGPGMGSGMRQDGQAYRVTLRMDDGSQQVFATATDPGFRPGDRVQIVNGVVQHY